MSEIDEISWASYNEVDDEVQRLQAELEQAQAREELLNKCIHQAIRWLCSISSADGSGHADLGKRLEAMHKQALSPQEPRNPTHGEEQVFDKALRRSVKIVDEKEPSK